MVISRVQEHLESIYGLRCEMRAEQYVVDRNSAVALGGRGDADEELLLREEAGELEVALFLCPQLVSRLTQLGALGEDLHLDVDLDGYCQLVEGVSHFLYLAQVAESGRRVSLLELEAQAEVDKFAICFLARWQKGRPWAEHIFRRLFDCYSLREGMSEAERWRYEEANRLARTFCGRLLRHVEERRLEKVFSDLRYCFRLGAEAKLRHLGQAA